MRHRRKWIPLISALLISTIGFAQALRETSESGPSPREQCKGSSTVINFLREQDGLHKAALQNNGHFVFCDTFNEGWIDYETVPQLLADSDLVAVGTTGTMADKLNRRGNYIQTETDFTVERILASKTATPPAVKVRIPGGSVTFTDGTSATISLYNYPRLKSGDRYILFLRDSHDGFYVPVAGPKGTFSIADTEVLPQAKTSSALASHYAHSSASSFAEEIIAGAERKKDDLN